MINQLWRLARTPDRHLPESEDFQWCEEPLPTCGDGQVLTRTVYLSLDPYQWVRRLNGVEPPGAVCHGRTVSQVLQSRHEDFAEGDYLFNTNGWQRHGLTGRDISEFGYMYPRKLYPELAPLSTAVGVMGMLGLTAYAGLIVQCDPQPGETVVVSAASGGVGQIVGQLARIRGARVVGIAGNDAKCRFLTAELGFHAAVCYRDDNYAEALAQACPDGCDVYFENVGGDVYAGVVPLLNHAARISVCGLISQYGETDMDSARAAWQATGGDTIARKSVQVHSLFVGDFVAQWQDRFFDEMAGYLRSGEVRYREDIRKGLEQAPQAMRDVLSGDNFGKTLVEVSAPFGN